MPTLVVEGWRSYAQSHSIVNKFQCLELLKRGDVLIRSLANLGALKGGNEE